MYRLRKQISKNGAGWKNFYVNHNLSHRRHRHNRCHSWSCRCVRGCNPYLRLCSQRLHDGSCCLHWRQGHNPYPRIRQSWKTQEVFPAEAAGFRQVWKGLEPSPGAWKGRGPSPAETVQTRQAWKMQEPFLAEAAGFRQAWKTQGAFPEEKRPVCSPGFSVCSDDG